MEANQQNLFPDPLQNDYPTSYLPVPSSSLYINKLTIANFKRIKDSEIELSPFTVLTGINNSGKSTILQAPCVAFECLRLCVERETWKISKTGRALVGFDFLPANEPPDLWYGRHYREGSRARAISIRVELSNGFFFDANINLYFGAINVRISNWNDAMGSEAVKEALQLAPMLIPGHVEVGPHEERRVTAQIHRHAMSGQLSPIIRNVLLSLSDAPLEGPSGSDMYNFDFVTDAIKRHFGISLEKLVFDPERDLDLRAPYKEETWKLDIVSAGSGLLQILKLVAFIAWRKSKIVLLDEPDAHLHTSLQVRLAEFLQELSSGLEMQIVLATHSRQLISQAPIESVTPVDSNAQKIKPIVSVDHLLAEYRRLGEINNVDLALLYQSKRCLFVEGKSDIRLLPLFANKLGFSFFSGMRQIVVFEFKGAEKFTLIKDLVELFEKMIGTSIVWFVLRDRDAATPTMLDHMKKEAKIKGINDYHIWEGYSIENYLLQPDIVISAVQAKAIHRKLDPPTEDEISELLAKACQKVLSSVRASFITYAQNYYNRFSLGSENRVAEAAEDALQLLESVSSVESQLKVLPGTKIFGEFVQLLQSKKQMTLRIEDLIQHITLSNVASELKTFFENLESFGVSNVAEVKSG